MKCLKRIDPEIYNLNLAELHRQRNVIELIASENVVSRAILEAVGSWTINKYAEGYPRRRYYGGCKYIDRIEQLAIDRAKKLFGAEHANVQPHSGSQANYAAYSAILEPGDTILGMSLDHGGHLTHGHGLNFSGKTYNFIAYGVNRETGRVDMDEVRALAQEHKPRLILAGFSAYPRELDFKEFREIADGVKAYLMVDMAHVAGLVATGLYPNPVPYAHIVTTTTHKTLRGPRGALILCQKEDPYNTEGLCLAKKIDRAVFPGSQGGPLENIIAGKAVAFLEALQPEFKEYQRQVMANAKALAGSLTDYGFSLSSGGTNNHLILLDVTVKGIGGKKAEKILDEAGLCNNKNLIPYDERKPMDPSGIRLGTPAVTTRGMKEPEMKQIAEWINKILSDPENTELQEQVRKEVQELCSRFPIYEGIVDQSEVDAALQALKNETNE